MRPKKSDFGSNKGIGTMKKLRMMTICLTVVFTGALFSSPQKAEARDLKVIYGEDSRLDLKDTVNPLHYELAQSTAAMIPNGSLNYDGDMVEINGSLLRSRGICEGERFDDQITAANCSGFLVAPDLLVTAGHCVRTQRDCDNSSWVFGFGIDVDTNYNPGDTTFDVPASNVYRCAEVVESELSRINQADHALLRLERVVDDREPLQFRTEGKVEDRTNLVVIGHPTGLPTKVAAGAWVRQNSNRVFFQANLDTFGGNSGSAVFDMETGLVEGILVRGEQDYVFDSERGCRVPKVCTEEGCRGEDVTRITNIEALMSQR